ncbi:UMP kinase [Candidatus Woesearchaeota archaeon]|nr:MAG: UMP kinase [Candidatus Woesearchaeota archaeon]
MTTVVLSLGGSIINPKKINIKFLKKFKKLILSRKEKFIIVCGGGKPAREYQNAAKKLGLSTKSQDKIGITATMLNAQLVKELFGNKAYEKVLQEPKKTKFTKIAIAAGWKPGCSTDKNAVLWAKKNSVRKVFNLSNINNVYDKDPKKYKNAKPIKKIKWKEYMKKITNKWKPGLSTPFDPIASKLAAKLKIKAYILNGKKLERLEKALDEKKFTGTIIE